MELVNLHIRKGDFQRFIKKNVQPFQNNHSQITTGKKKEIVKKNIYYNSQNYKNVFVILDYEMPADSAVYLFTQNYTQTAIACGDNK